MPKYTSDAAAVRAAPSADAQTRAVRRATGWQSPASPSPMCNVMHTVKIIACAAVRGQDSFCMLTSAVANARPGDYSIALACMQRCAVAHAPQPGSAV